jgi:hypothetical protein
MANVSRRFSALSRASGRCRAVWPLTVRQRIFLYLVFAAIAGLGCATLGDPVDYSIDANRMDCQITTTSDSACIAEENLRSCDGHVFSNGNCKLIKCTKPCDGPKAAVRNCEYSSALNAADCQARAAKAGCTEIRWDPQARYSQCTANFCTSNTCNP